MRIQLPQREQPLLISSLRTLIASVTLAILSQTPLSFAGPNHGMSVLRFSNESNPFNSAHQIILDAKSAQITPLSAQNVDLFSESDFHVYLQALREKSAGKIPSPYGDETGFNQRILAKMERDGPGSRRADFCNNVLSAIDGIPLRKMVSRGFLTPEEALLFASPSSGVSPSQFTFLLKNIDEKASVDIPMNDFLGSLKMISGQDPFGRTLRLPQDLGEIDRKKYPYLWVFSRFSSEKRELIPEILRSSLWVMKNEMDLMGKSLKDGWIFAHSMSHQHTELYLRIYKMEIDHVINAERGETLLRKRADQMAEKWAPEFLVPHTEFQAERLVEKLRSVEYTFNQSHNNNLYWANLSPNDSPGENSALTSWLSPELLAQVKTMRKENPLQPVLIMDVGDPSGLEEILQIAALADQQGTLHSKILLVSRFDLANKLMTQDFRFQSIVSGPGSQLTSRFSAIPRSEWAFLDGLTGETTATSQTLFEVNTQNLPAKTIRCLETPAARANLFLKMN